MKTQIVQNNLLRGSSVEKNSAPSRAIPGRTLRRYSALLFLFSGGALNAATGLAGRLSISAEAGLVHREPSGQTQPGVYPGSRVLFRNGSGETKSYGAVQIGVKIAEHFTLRAGYQDFGNTYVRFVTPPNIISLVPFPEDFRFHDRAFTLDPVFTWKPGARVTIHAFWGIALNEADITLENYPPRLVTGELTKNSTTARSRLGAGIDLQLTSHLSLRAGGDYQRFSSFTKEGWLAHAGLAYAF